MSPPYPLAMPIRLVLAEDHYLVREGIRGLLGTQPDLEVIGEACANLSEDLTQSHPDIPWQKASAIRNRLVHGYFDVDLRVVWRTARESLPPFARQVRALVGPQMAR